MRNAARLLITAAGAIALAGCHKQAEQNAAASQDMSPDTAINQSGDVPPNAEIETLPPDESSETPSSQLNSGEDNADVNNLGNGH